MKRAQQIIIDHLRAMRNDLGNCEQTTHVHILAIGTLEHVGKEMEAAFDNPTAYHVANLVQTIEEFLKLAWPQCEGCRVPSSPDPEKHVATCSCRFVHLTPRHYPHIAVCGGIGQLTLDERCVTCPECKREIERLRHALLEIKHCKIYRMPKCLVENTDNKAKINDLLPEGETLVDVWEDKDRARPYLLVKVAGNGCPPVRPGETIPQFPWPEAEADAPSYIKR